MRKNQKLEKIFYSVFHSKLIYLYLGVFLLFLIIFFFVFYKVHFQNLSLIENYTQSLGILADSSQKNQKELVNSIKDSTDVLADNATLVIGIVGSFGLIFTILLPYRESKKQNFRTNFFEYLRIHRENVQQIETRDKKGHDAFIDIYKELKFVLEKFPSDFSVANIYKLEWAYLFVFFGLGETSTPILKNYLKKHYSDFESEIDPIILSFSHLKDRYLSKNKGKTFDVFGYKLNFKKDVQNAYNLKCILDGHQSDLGHYYRHLYQMITYVDEFPVLKRFERYDYVKNVRAQFSNHELVLFLANVYSPLGNVWLKSGLIVKYELIKNLPVSLFTPFGKDIKLEFSSIEFES
ncbi:putative phage abortive infection protein [Sphingobacterium kitahiroshimense]|uniref:putative phage abortive infection protein n=1 Tax=Sphingobacterium kitahiroshimense TaxID=470446 RepID=UPI00320B30F1